MPPEKKDRLNLRKFTVFLQIGSEYRQYDYSVSSREFTHNKNDLMHFNKVS